MEEDKRGRLKKSKNSKTSNFKGNNQVCVLSFHRKNALKIRPQAPHEESLW